MKNYIKNLWFAIECFFGKSSSLKNNNIIVSILREFKKPPFGGGNQFMLALKVELEKNENVTVLNNIVSEIVDGYIIDSVWFDRKLLKLLNKQKTYKLLHRIDGPIHLYRGKDKHIDDEIFEINKNYATSTVIQSKYTFQRLYDTGYDPVNPVIIKNAVNSDIFNSVEKKPFHANKIKLVSTSWSDNPMKGGDIYKWLDENLDWSKYEYLFIGRTSETFINIKIIEPVGSELLADYLRKSDIYITASRNDSCSNALIEALSCSLPALYINSGGNPELVKRGGLPFEDITDIIPSLNQIVKNYDNFQDAIQVDSMQAVSKSYLKLIQ